MFYFYYFQKWANMHCHSTNRRKNEDKFKPLREIIKKRYECGSLSHNMQHIKTYEVCVCATSAFGNEPGQM